MEECISMIEALQTFFQENFPPQLAVFLISMIPLVECRGAIPFGIVALQMPLWEVLPLSIVGNILPVPFILLLIRPVINWFKKTKLLSPLAHWIEGKADKKKDKVLKYSKWGLFFFVAVPIPGTGAWTGDRRVDRRIDRRAARYAHQERFHHHSVRHDLRGADYDARLHTGGRDHQRRNLDIY